MYVGPCLVVCQCVPSGRRKLQYGPNGEFGVSAWALFGGRCPFASIYMTTCPFRKKKKKKKHCLDSHGPSSVSVPL